MRRLALCVVLLAATACGTTVSPTGQQALQPADDGLGLPGSTSVPTSPPTTVRPGRASGTPTASGPTPTGPTAPAGPTTTRPAVPRGGTIVIGYETHKDGASAVAAVGISGASTGDTDNQMRAIAAAVNARGGILGRKVVLAPHDVRTLEAVNNREASDSASCADWLDKKVFAVVNIGLRPVLRSCLAKAGVPIVSSIGISTAASVYGNTLPGVYAPSAMSIDRYVAAVIDRLVARRFFTGWDPATGRPGPLPVKIGMQSFSDADGQHVVAVTRKALAAHGLQLDEVEAHSMNLNDNSASTSGAVLRFRAKGITHVIDANLLFFKGADSQGYHPRYVIQDTINTPALLTKNVGASQLHGAMGAGYLPLYEVDNPPDPSPEATRCKALMRKAGEDTTNAVAAALMLHECDAVAFLEQALTAGGAVSAAALRAGAASMGPFASHLTYASRITGSRHDGATRVRDFDYVDACSCFRFTSPTTYPVD
jgi:ABC-type branched-subunit amino acid transport system substrate-binding protein